MTKKEIAERLRSARVAAGMTQVQAADAIGRKQQTLASWEVGQSQPDANTLFELCRIYGASVDEAFGFKLEDKEKSPAELPAGEVLYNFLYQKYGRPPTLEELEKVDKLVDMFIDKPQ